MGAWGTGIFENDDAGDWLWQYEDNGASAVETALKNVHDAASSGMITAPAGSIALAAAEVVAAALGKPASGLDDERLASLMAHAPAVKALDDIANRAIKAAVTVMGQTPDGQQVMSELPMLWMEDGVDEADFQSFMAAVKDLGLRLKAAASEEN